MAQEYLLALGSNLGSSVGSPLQTLTFALSQLARGKTELRRVSRFYATPCFPAGVGPDYINACAVIRSEDGPAEVLARLHELENDLGRTRAQRWGSRSLDLDLLAAGSTILPDTNTLDTWMSLPSETQRIRAPDQLILPHPRLHERAFVLVPLLDVAPFWRHPVLNRTVAELCASISPELRQEVVAIEP